MIKRMLLLWFGLAGLLFGEGVDEKTLTTSDGRVRLFGPDAVVLQETAVWAVRGLRGLERDAGRQVPFQENVPILIRFEPGLEQTRLLEVLRGTQLWQEILTPATEAPDAVGLADMLSRAVLNRLLWQAGPGPQPQAPDWLVMAFSHLLLDGLTPRLLEEGLASWRSGRISSPVRITNDARFPTLAEVPLGVRAQSLLAFRFWSFLQGDSGRVWESLGRNPLPGLEEWSVAGSGRDLRDLHILWDLWLSQRDLAAIADLRDGERATRRLEQILLLRPAEYGFGGEEVPRYEVLRFPDLKEYLREPWVEPLLQSWIVRAHLLRFRQAPEFLDRVDLYVMAARELLGANRSKGRAREESIAAFERAFQAAEGLRPPTSQGPAL